MKSFLGFGVVEIVVVAGIISLVFISILQLVVVATQPVSGSGRQIQAVFLAEEAVEAVRLLRNESWSENIGPKGNNTPYYPVLAGGSWTLSATNPGLVDDVFTRTVQFQAVHRDGSSNISTVGTLDEKTRKVIASVNWNEHGETKTITIETYITNFLGT